LVGQAGLKSDTVSEQSHLIEKFQDALNRGILAKVLDAETEPKTIEDWYKKAIQFDVSRRNIAARFKTRYPKEMYTPYSEKKNWNFDKPARDPNTMDVDAMTIEEQNDLMKKGACFFCKQPGHIATNCPKKKKKNLGYYKTYEQKDDPPKKPKEKNFKAYIRALTEEEKTQFAEELIEDTDDDDMKKDLEDF